MNLLNAVILPPMNRLLDHGNGLSTLDEYLYCGAVIIICIVLGWAIIKYYTDEIN